MGIGVSGRVTTKWDSQFLAVIDMVVGELRPSKLLGRLDEGSRKTHLDMPLNVAMEQEDSGVLDPETQNRVRLCVDVDSVTTRGRRLGGARRPLHRPAFEGGRSSTWN